MPFGKYRGLDIASCPKGYLRWVATLDLADDLRNAVELGIEGIRYNAPPVPDIDYLVHKAVCEWPETPLNIG